MRNTIFKALSAVIFMFFSATLSAHLHLEQDVQEFIHEMVDIHGFDRDELNSIFARAEIAQSILDAISRPAEAMPWYKYRKIFIRSDRIRLGIDFIRDNRELLEAAEREYGVPPEIIAAIIGVETRYGSNTGGYKVIDSLVTLGFRYPKRAEFFKRELEQFLLLAREQGLDPHSVTGSYAGAMGIPQFISSSYRHYAVDFDGDGHIDIWNNPADAIGSVANYFSEHGWKRGNPIVFPADINSDRYEEFVSSGLEPNIVYGELKRSGIVSMTDIDDEIKVRLFSYEIENGQEFWLGMHNFYVITRYNHSSLYAMAVYQLSREILHGLSG